MEDETTTTPEASVDTGAEIAQPVQAEDSSVAGEQPSTEPSEVQQGEETDETSQPNVDDKLKKYALSQGLELDSPSAIKAANIAMKAQSEATRNYHKTSEMQKTMETMSDLSAEATAEQTGQDPEVLKRLQRMEVRDSIRDFWDKTPDARQYEQEMSEIAQTAGLYGSPEAILKASYSIAVANNANKVKSQGRREALESLAHKQQAAVPKGHATNPSATPPKKPFSEMSIKEMEAHLGKVRR
jgi:hypothetical protein